MTLVLESFKSIECVACETTCQSSRDLYKAIEELEDDDIPSLFTLNSGGSVVSRDTPGSLGEHFPSLLSRNLTLESCYDCDLATSSNGTEEMDSWGRSSYADRSYAVVPFVGLSNQGATCYLNSLIQVCFKTVRAHF